MYLCDLPLATVWQLFLKKKLILPTLAPQPGLFGLWSDDKNYGESIINYALLILKLQPKWKTSSQHYEFT